MFHPKGYKQDIADYSYIGNIQFIIQMHPLLQWNIADTYQRLAIRYALKVGCGEKIEQYPDEIADVRSGIHQLGGDEQKGRLLFLC